MSKPAWSVQDLVANDSYVLHIPTGTVAKAVRVWTGAEGDVWVSSANGLGVAAPVLELSTGDAFLLTEDAFEPLTKQEVVVFEAAQRMMTAFVEVNGSYAAGLGLELPRFVCLMVAALQVQQRALQALQ